MSTYTTRDEAIQHEIVKVIQAGDVEDARAEFDIDAIADQLIVWEDAYDETRNAHMLNAQGFRLADEYLPEQDEDGMAFWSVVEDHAR